MRWSIKSGASAAPPRCWATHSTRRESKSARRSGGSPASARLWNAASRASTQITEIDTRLAELPAERIGCGDVTAAFADFGSVL